ncbi:probable UDP-3-O-acylglucosamine N-acyltransferase 2, mitochondrial isoform X2 [Tripterygium wilfordii]|uniref:probable UDP-3-O-acylglucosamine N-acyltransferase 2, mitochondrial isoform X2 n=1 Tax=Tripterygium wilfordii TaxID=458696 RepID=UPI0018F838A8|nr:probable UDP-3-O-acylglucosamine N-acyltransferase 2, mitochondrial isoform X2 [Tripterygium wilfordii]
MAVYARRLSFFGPSKPISYLFSSRAFIEKFRALSLSRSSSCHLFSVYSCNEFENDAENGGHGFTKWRNGGGIFHNSACIDPTVLIEIGAIVQSKAIVGANVSVGSGAVIGPDVTIGQSTKIGYNVSLSNCTIGDSCVIHNGVCIGQDGFGFYVDEHGNMVKKPQIGHNVVIGSGCMLCGQVGIAGSATIGDYVTLGGRAAIRDHVFIASKVRLAANSCATKDIQEAGDYGGFPAVPINEWRRQVVAKFRTTKKELPQG